MSASPTFRHRLEYALFLGADAVLRFLPWKAAMALGRGLGRFFRLLDARHRRVVRENLRGSGLDLDEAGVEALSRSCFEHFGTVAMSLFPLLHAKPEDLDRWIIVEGLEHFDAVQAAGKGFIQLTGHYGNWEAVALAQSAKGRRFAAIGRALENPYLDARLRAFRTRFGNELIPKAGAVREAVKTLKAGRGVGFLLDQNALTAGIFVKFLGRWASTFPTAGTLAVKYRLPILPVFSWPEPDGRIRVRFEPPFEVPITGDTDRDVWTATQLMSWMLEARIRKDPRWWFWMHRRFKTRPDSPGPPFPAPLPDPAWVEGLSEDSLPGRSANGDRAGNPE